MPIWRGRAPRPSIRRDRTAWTGRLAAESCFNRPRTMPAERAIGCSTDTRKHRGQNGWRRLGRPPTPDPATRGYLLGCSSTPRRSGNGGRGTNGPPPTSREPTICARRSTGLSAMARTPRSACVSPAPQYRSGTNCRPSPRAGDVSNGRCNPPKPCRAATPPSG